MRPSLHVATGLIGATLVLAASCGFDPTGLPASTSASASAASGGNGGAAGTSTTGVSSTTSVGGGSSTSSATSSSGTGGAGPTILAVAGVLLVDLDVNDATAGTSD